MSIRIRIATVVFLLPASADIFLSSVISGDTERDFSRTPLTDTTTGFRPELQGGVAQVMECARLPARSKGVLWSGVSCASP